MTEQALKKRILQIVKRAERRGLTINKNNISKARPINRICNALKTKTSYSAEELLCRY